MKHAVSAHHCHDLSDETWALLEPHLPGREGVWGGIAKDNRLLIDAVFWRLRTGAPGRDWPPDYGAGATPTAGSCAGGIRAFGNGCWIS